MRGVDGRFGKSPNQHQCEPSGLETMTQALMHASNYHEWMFSQVADFVGMRVLEVGAGSGNLTQFLPARARVTALDESRAALDVAASRVGRRNLETVVADIANPSVTEGLAHRGFDTILCSNVLEHIEDDLAAVANMFEILRPLAGRVLLIVPAHIRLYGSLDRAAGHHRRYSKAKLTTLLGSVGFEVLRARYVNALGAVAWYVNGTVLRTSDLNARSVNAQAMVFDRFAVPVLQRLEAVLNPPFGQSLIVVGQAVGADCEAEQHEGRLL